MPHTYASSANITMSPRSPRAVCPAVCVRICWPISAMAVAMRPTSFADHTAAVRARSWSTCTNSAGIGSIRPASIALCASPPPHHVPPTISNCCASYASKSPLFTIYPRVICPRTPPSIRSTLTVGFRICYVASRI